MYSRLYERFNGLIENQRGATSAEYALMAALIAVVIIGAVTLLGTTVRSLFQLVSNL